MGAKSLADALSGGDWVKISDLEGETLTLGGEFEVREGQHGEYCVFDAITSEGEEIEVRGSETVLGQLRRLKKYGHLDNAPEVKVVSFDTKFKNKGYKLEEA